MGVERNVLAVHPRGRVLCTVAATLGCAGYRVLTARVPEQIPTILAERRVEAIVACGESQRLRAALDVAGCRVPVVVVVREGEKQPATEDYDAVLFEPIDSGRLPEVVNSLLEGRQAPGRTSLVLERHAS